MKFDICPNCEQLAIQEFCMGEDEHLFRGVYFYVPSKFYLCHKCKFEYSTPEMSVENNNDFFRIKKELFNLSDEDIFLRRN